MDSPQNTAYLHLDRKSDLCTKNVVEAFICLGWSWDVQYHIEKNPVVSLFYLLVGKGGRSLRIKKMGAYNIKSGRVLRDSCGL